MLKRIIVLLTVAALMAAMVAANAAPVFAQPDFCDIDCEEDPGNGVVPPTFDDPGEEGPGGADPPVTVNHERFPVPIDTTGGPGVIVVGTGVPEEDATFSCYYKTTDGGTIREDGLDYDDAWSDMQNLGAKCFEEQK